MQSHTHTRHNPSKPSAAVAPDTNATPRIKARRTIAAAAAMPEVHDDELLHLATDIAYFRAAQYREVASGDIRAEDIRRAASEIAALFGREPTQ